MNRRQTHWVEFLSIFDFEIKYKPKKRNLINIPFKKPDYNKPDIVYITGVFKINFYNGRKKSRNNSTNAKNFE